MKGSLGTLAGFVLILAVAAAVFLSGAGSHPCAISCFGPAPVPAATALAGAGR